jgi:hypothetical protein
VYWRKGPNCRGLLLLRPLDTTCPVPCLMAYLAVNALLRWVSYAVASIMLSSVASAPSLSPTALGYMVKALALKALYY